LIIGLVSSGGYTVLKFWARFWFDSCGRRLLLS
jgi:hypothetical protein